MSRSASRAWLVFCVVGIALWIGATVVVAVVNDDPSDGRPVVLAFAAGAAAFFAAVFGFALWQTRPRETRELDALLAELALEPAELAGGARAIGAMRRVARTYILLGALVTALGLVAIVEEALGFGSVAPTLYALGAIVVAWALAVPWVLRRARAASVAVLSPLGLSQSGAALAGERHGRRVSISLDASGSRTEVASGARPPALAGEAILAYAGRGERRTWAEVAVTSDEDSIKVTRRGHEGPAWLWDLWLAERLAGGQGR